jgi:2-methylcitrate dehydratase
VDKFHWLAEPFCDQGLRADIIAAVDQLDDIPVAELTRLLGAVSRNPQRSRRRHRL